MASKGQNELEAIVRELLPMETITKEHHIGEKLRLDLYYPKYKIGFEYHGRQHFEYVEHFHYDIYGFQDSLARDQRKIVLCNNLGIVLLVFRFDDRIDEETVAQRMQTAIRDSEPFVAPLKPTKNWGKIDKTTDFYKENLLKQKQLRKESYQKMKEYKKRIDGR